MCIYVDVHSFFRLFLSWSEIYTLSLIDVRKLTEFHDNSFGINIAFFAQYVWKYKRKILLLIQFVMKAFCFAENTLSKRKKGCLIQVTMAKQSIICIGIYEESHFYDKKKTKDESLAAAKYLKQIWRPFYFFPTTTFIINLFCNTILCVWSLHYSDEWFSEEDNTN